MRRTGFAASALPMFRVISRFCARTSAVSPSCFLIAAQITTQVSPSTSDPKAAIDSGRVRSRSDTDRPMTGTADWSCSASDRRLPMYPLCPSSKMRLNGNWSKARLLETDELHRSYVVIPRIVHRISYESAIEGIAEIAHRRRNITLRDEAELSTNQIGIDAV